MKYRETLLALAFLAVAGPAVLADEPATTAGVLQSWWIPGLPSVVIRGEHNAVDPVVRRSPSGDLLVAAESRGKDGNAVLVARSTDGGRTWDNPREVARATRGNRISAGAAGTL